MTDSPAVLHVGGFFHADGQLDLQVGVLAVLGNHHPVELGLLWTGGGWTEDHLRESSQVRTASTFTASRGRSHPVREHLCSGFWNQQQVRSGSQRRRHASPKVKVLPDVNASVFRNRSDWNVCVVLLTRPSSLSSRARTPVLSVKSFTLTDGSG